MALNSGSRRPAGGSVGLEWVQARWDLGLELHLSFSSGLSPTFRALRGLGLCWWMPLEFEWEERVTEEGNQPLSAKGSTSTQKRISARGKKTTHFRVITNPPTPFLVVENIRALRVNCWARKMCSPWCSWSRGQNLMAHVGDIYTGHGSER